ncbi:MAG: hypothetical protein ONB11_07975, partial [candidate division KSB1 bacterium]|nr:hypothetical protein [candidate division KSB1 bacterium]
MGANFPNPFNPKTIIPYALPVAAHVTIHIFNLLGEEVAVLLDQPQNAGFHRVVWNGKNNPGTVAASG